MYKPILPIASVNGYAVNPGWYAGFEVASDEDDLAALHAAWATPAQRAYNSAHRTCDRCTGRGYLQFRDRGGKMIRENCGCPKCFGTGAVRKE